MFNDPINVTKGQWMGILKNKNIIAEEDYELLKLIYYCEDGKVTASWLAKKLKKRHHGPINKQVGLLGERVVKELDQMFPEQKHDGVDRWWNVPFLGEGMRKKIRKDFIGN